MSKCYLSSENPSAVVETNGLKTFYKEKIRYLAGKKALKYSNLME